MFIPPPLFFAQYSNSFNQFHILDMHMEGYGIFPLFLHDFMIVDSDVYVCIFCLFYGLKNINIFSGAERLPPICAYSL